MYPFCDMMDVVAHVSYFQQKCVACDVVGLSSFWKCITIIRMLNYGVVDDPCEEYCKFGESITMEALNRFCRTMKECFESRYLWQPNKVNIDIQLQISVDYGFLGMFANLNCMHYAWKSGPMSQQYQFNNKDNNDNIIL